MRFLPALLGVVVILGVTPGGWAAEPPADARELIDRVIGAYGGRAALERVRSYRLEGRTVAILRDRVGGMTRLFARPTRLRVDLRYPGEPEHRIVDGGRGWRRIGDGDFEEASGPMLEAMVLQAARANVPWILMERAAAARRVEPLEHRGRRLIGLEIPLERGLVFRAYVDPHTFRVELSRGTLDHFGMQTDFETVYDDFRMVRGVLFAFREENYASGAHTGYTAIERVILNPRIAPGDFAPPPSGRSSS